MPRAASADPAPTATDDAPRLSAQTLLQRVAKKDQRAALFAILLASDPDTTQTDAYATAFPRCTRDSARALAPKLVRRPDVAAAIEALKAERLAKIRPGFDLTAERIAQEAARIAYADIRDVVEWSGETVTLKASGELTEDAARAIAQVERVPTQFGTRIRVKQHDKLGALNLLAKMTPGALAKQQVEHSGTVTLAELLAAPPASTPEP